jgi:Tol biopolymer transport system component
MEEHPRIRLLAAITTLVAAVAAATGTAAPAPVAEGPGLVVSHGGWIYVDGRRVTTGSQPTWGPNGTQIAFTRHGQILVIDRDGTNERRPTKREPGLHWPGSFPAWSPDGKRIAFSGTRDLFAVRVADRKLTPLTRSRHSWLGNFTPAYSPDGRTIAFSRSTDAFNSDIFLMSAEGRNLRRLTRSRGTHESLGEESTPTWSADGRTIVFVSNRDGDLELYSIGRNGRGERRITHTPQADEENPRFSRDGRRLLYVHDGRVATMRIDGTGVRELGLGTSADWR